MPAPHTFHLSPTESPRWESNTATAHTALKWLQFAPQNNTHFSIKTLDKVNTTNGERFIVSVLLLTVAAEKHQRHFGRINAFMDTRIHKPNRKSPKATCQFFALRFYAVQVVLCTFRCIQHGIGFYSRLFSVMHNARKHWSASYHWPSRFMRAPHFVFISTIFS